MGCFKLFFRSNKSKKAVSEKPSSFHARPVRISDTQAPLLTNNNNTVRQRVPHSSRGLPTYGHPHGNNPVQARTAPVAHVPASATNEKVNAEAAANENPEEAARRKKAEEEEQERLDFFQMM